MRRARQEMLTFVSKADDFLHCIETAQKEDKQLFDSLGGKDPGREADYRARQQEFELRYNAGVEAQKSAAAKFNEQLHVWKNRAGQPATKSG